MEWLKSEDYKIVFGDSYARSYYGLLYILPKLVGLIVEGKCKDLVRYIQLAWLIKSVIA
jgi:hypothetical protein